jgi:DNA-binding transcriptional ArsR family regulator
MRNNIYTTIAIYDSSHIQETPMTIDTDLALPEAQAQMLKAMAHPFRIRLLEVLSVAEECVCHLVSLFGRPQPYISQQLAALKEAGLVQDRRVAQRVFYGISDPRVVELLANVRVLMGGSENIAERHVSVPGCTCPKCNPEAI